MKKNSIIIPHYNGKKILFRCIKSIKESSKILHEIIVVDNASSDDSISYIKQEFPDVKIVKSSINLGYAGGCNLGAKKASSEYLIFLNNDTIVENGWDQKLILGFDDTNISSVQPKIKNLSKKNHFDYAGASGGFIDVFCYPFCRGRIFNTVEKDLGQYDSKENIFWASGAGFATKKDIFFKAGMFDTKLFAHMEEIDYHWRCQMMGYKIIVCPESVIFHEGGATLSYESYKKTYLNHRNSMILFLTNHNLKTCLYLIFPRLILQLSSIIRDFLLIKPGHAIAQIASLISLLFNIAYIIDKRKKNKLIRLSGTNINTIYNRSIVIDYFIFNTKVFSKLNALDLKDD